MPHKDEFLICSNKVLASIGESDLLAVLDFSLMKFLERFIQNVHHQDFVYAANSHVVPARMNRDCVQCFLSFSLLAHFHLLIPLIEEKYSGKLTSPCDIVPQSDVAIILRRCGYQWPLETDIYLRNTSRVESLSDDFVVDVIVTFTLMPLLLIS